MKALIGLSNFAVGNFSAKCTTLSETLNGHVPPNAPHPSIKHDVIWQHLLLKIAMTHPLSNLRVRTLNINSGDVPAPQTCLGTYQPPHLSIKPCLDMTSFGNTPAWAG